MLVGPTLAPPRALPSHSTSPIRGMAFTLLHKHRSYVSLHQRLGWSGLGSMGPLSWTWSPPIDLGIASQPNICTCCVHNRLWEAIKALRLKGGGILRRSTPHLGRLASKFAPPTFYTTCKYPQLPLDTIKGAVVLGGEAHHVITSLQVMSSS
jgi:hypothetical protein